MSVPEASKIRKPEQAQHRDQGEVVEVGRLAGPGEQRLELQVVNPKVGDSAAPLAGGRARPVTRRG